MSQPLLTPDFIGRLCSLMAQEAGHVVSSYSAGYGYDSYGLAAGMFKLQVRLVLIDGTYLVDFNESDRALPIDELRAKLIAARPNLFKPKVDEKAELKKRIRDALEGAITHLDGLRAELQILKEIHE